MQITHSASLVFCLSTCLIFALSTLGIAMKGTTSFSFPRKTSQISVFVMMDLPHRMDKLQ
jgi:hypothetical protein